MWKIYILRHLLAHLTFEISINYHQKFLFWILYILYIKYQIIKDINLLFLFLSPPLSLHVLTYPPIVSYPLLISSSKYSIKYLELFFVYTNFDMNILLIPRSKVILFFCRIKFFFYQFCLTLTQHHYIIKNFIAIIF